MPTIRTLHSQFESLSELQSSVVKGVAGEIARVRGDSNVTARALRDGVRALVQPDDHETYAQLSAVARQAGTKDNFTALVAEWTATDARNREERAALDGAWGSRAQVAEKTAALKEELGIIRDALKDVSPEIAAFDAATAQIATHNETYPKATITEDSFNDLEKFKLGRFLLWLTFINRGPHRAHKIVSTYAKPYGNYFEDAREIAAMRENEARLQDKEKEQQADFERHSAAGARMDELDGSYRGSEGIARDVRSIVAERVLKLPAFGAALTDVMPSAQTMAIAVDALKIRAFDAVESHLEGLKDRAQMTQNRLSQSAESISRAVSVVGGRSVRFTIDNIESAVNRGVKTTRAALRTAEEAREAVDSFAPAAGMTLAQASEILTRHVALPVVNNEVTYDDSTMRSQVRAQVDAYEAEERRRIEAERAARAAAEAAARAARESAARVQRRHSGTIGGGSIGGGFNRSSSSSSISRGSSGIGTRSGGGSIGGGSRGIGPRR